MLFVVVGQQVTIGLNEPDVHQLVSLGLDAAQDLAGEASGHAVGFDEDQSFFDRVVHEFSFGSESVRAASSAAAFRASSRRPVTKQ